MIMDKQETIKNLSDRGFSSYLEDGIVMVNVKNEKEMKAVKKAIKEIGYNRSFGFKIGGKTNGNDK